MKASRTDNNKLRTDEMRMNLDNSYKKEMIEIVVDCNNDTIKIGDAPAIHARYPSELVQIIGIVIDAVVKDGIHVSLIKIDEDTRQTIEEW